MSRESFVFLLGLFVFFAPFLGVPTQWKTIGLAVVGALLMIAGYSLRRSAFLRSLDDGVGERKGDAFVESGIPRTQDTETVQSAQTFEKDSTPV